RRFIGRGEDSGHEPGERAGAVRGVEPVHDDAGRDEIGGEQRTDLPQPEQGHRLVLERLAGRDGGASGPRHSSPAIARASISSWFSTYGVPWVWKVGTVFIPHAWPFARSASDHSTTGA